MFYLCPLNTCFFYYWFICITSYYCRIPSLLPSTIMHMLAVLVVCVPDVLCHGPSLSGVVTSVIVAHLCNLMPLVFFYSTYCCYYLYKYSYIVPPHP